MGISVSSRPAWSRKRVQDRTQRYRETLYQKKERDCILLLSHLFYFSMAVRRHYAQDNFQKKVLNGTYSFRGWVHDPHGREHGSRKQAWCGSNSWELTSWNTWGRKRANSHASSNNATPPNPSHIVLWTGGRVNYSNICAYESHSHSDTYSIPVPVGFWPTHQNEKCILSNSNSPPSLSVWTISQDSHNCNHPVK